MSYHPHVAVFRDRLEPTGRCDADQAAGLLKRLSALLPILGPAAKHPGLALPHAIDSIGVLLVGKDRDHEACRALVMGEADGPPPPVTLKRRGFEVLSNEQAEQLEDRTRLLCVPIRGRSEVARRLEEDERALAELTVELERGAKVVLRQHRDPLRAVLVITAIGGVSRKIIEARLASEHASLLASCFEGAGVGRLGVVPPEPIAARFVPTSGRGFHELPNWMTEHLATVAQDLFRIHVLLSGATDVSRIVFAEKAQLFKFEETANDPRALIKMTLHSASGGCVCKLHRRDSPAEFRAIELRIRVCNAALETVDGERRCPRHYDPADASTHDPLEAPRVHPGHCCKGLAFELWCTHDRAKDPRAGLSIPLGVPCEWMLRPLRELAAACCALALPSHSADEPSAKARLEDLRANVDAAMQALERERMANAHNEVMLQPYDKTAVWCFRNDAPSFGRDGKMKGKRVRAEFHAIGKTHGHLFKRSKP